MGGSRRRSGSLKSPPARTLSMCATQEEREKWSSDFEKDGFLVIPNFASEGECFNMIRRMDELITEWDPEELAVFRTDNEQEKAQGSSDYFLDSADRIHFFLEPQAVDEKTGCLKESFEKRAAVNKVGHGLHVADAVFRKYSTSNKIASLVSALGYTNPVLPQSMYIFKQPIIGETVTSHQDSSFLFTTPRQTCLGLWLALQDATLDNGCLWARPGSHKEPVRRHFRRNPSYFESGEGSQMVFESLTDEKDALSWEGGLPEGKSPADVGFVAAPMKAGDLFVIHGSLDHLSLPNTSPHSRHTFQLHLIEGEAAGVKWSPHNWLQYPEGKPFPAIQV